MDGNGRHQKKKIKFKNTLFKQKKITIFSLSLLSLNSLT
jgi:hypothetical protein